MKKVAIFPYIKKPGVKEMVERSARWLDERGINVAIPQIEAGELGLQAFSSPEDQLFAGADLVVVLGGDGTTLRALRMMGEETLPVLGVNLGEMGFLMRINPPELEDALELVRLGKFRIEERHMLEARIRIADKTITRLALNDVLIGREQFSRLIKLDVLINDTYFCRYSADGVLLTTPTGSTAYSLSAGGPIISPGAEVFAMVPICPHSLNNRTLVFSAGERLTIKPVLKESMASTGVSVDGVAIEELNEVSAVDIGLASNKFKFVSLNGPDFYQSLSQKLQRWLGLDQGG